MATADTQALKLLINEVIEENSTICTLRSDVATIKTKQDEHSRDIRELKSDVKDLKSDVKDLKSDVKDLKSDVKDLKSDVKELKSDVTELKSNVFSLGVMMEEMKQQQQQILDAVIPAKQRAAQVDAVFNQVDDHEHRLCAVETVIKERDLL